MVRQGSQMAAVCRSRQRFILWFVSVLAGSNAIIAAEPFALRANQAPGDAANVEVVLQVGGDLLLTTDPSQASNSSLAIRKLPMSVAAKLVYDEQKTAIREGDTNARRAVRYYHSAKAVVEIEKGDQKPALQEDHRVVAVETKGSETTLLCPSGPISREELDLIDIPASTLLLDELLPAEEVTLGQSWKHSDVLVAGLLGLDAVSLADVQSMLAEVDDKKTVAKISLAGTVHGAVGGVSTEIELKAKYSFDLKAKRITLFALLIKEKRSIGHVGPGVDIVAKQVIKIKPIEPSPQLEAAIAAVAARQSDERALRLAFESPENRFRIEHDRRWFVTTDEKKLTIFRYVDRGELVAQCNIAVLDAPTRETFALADFQSDIQKTLGKKFGQFVTAKEETDRAGQRVFRVVASGTVSDLPIQWIYYLISTPGGQRLSVAFTMEQELVERFGQADRQFLSALEIQAPQTAATGQPTPAKR